MVGHLGKFFPDEFAAIGEPAIREMIRYGIQRAATYGIVGQRDVCLYLDVMVEFGRDFDVNVPWASAILNDDMDDDPSSKVDRLFSMSIALDDPEYAKKLKEKGILDGSEMP
jgi:hypothetical protein